MNPRCQKSNQRNKLNKGMLKQKQTVFDFLREIIENIIIKKEQDTISEKEYSENKRENIKQCKVEEISQKVVQKDKDLENLEKAL